MKCFWKINERFLTQSFTLVLIFALAAITAFSQTARTPSEPDETAQTAARLVTEATMLAGQKTIESRRAALLKLGAAQKLFHKIDDKTNEAICWLASAKISEALDDRQQALEFYEQVLPLARAVGDQAAEALTLGSIGGIYFDGEEWDKALEFYAPARLLYGAVGDGASEAGTLNNMGLAYSNLGDKQTALQHYEQALPLARAAGNKQIEAATLSNLGLLYHDIDDTRKSLEYYNQALPLARNIGDKAGEATTLNNIGTVYRDLGDKQKALEYYNQALPLRREANDKRGEAVTLGNIGSAYSDLGEMQKALDFYNQSLALNRSAGDRDGEATALNSIGLVFLDLGEREKAVEYFMQSLPLYRALKDKSGEATTLGNIGLAYMDEGKMQQALDSYLLALPLFKSVGDRNGEANALNNIGGVYNYSDERPKAMAYYAQALQLVRAGGDLGGEATALNNIGRFYDESGDYRKAIDYYDQSLPLYQTVGDRDGEAVTFNNLMYSWNALGNRRLAVFYGKQAINKYQQLRQAIDGLDREQQQSYLKNNEKTYRKLAETLIFAERLPEAQQVLNSFKDQQFFDSNKSQTKKPAAPLNLAPHETDFAALFDKAETRIGAARKQTADLLRNIGSRKPNAREAAQIRNLKSDEKIASNEFNAVLKQAEVNFAQPISEKDKVGAIVDTERMQATLRDISQQTGQKTVAVYQLLGEKNFHALVITPDTISKVSAPVKNTILNERALQFWGLLQSDAYDPTRLGAELYETVFKPLEAKLPKDTKTILWSLDGNLRYVPMAALYDGERKQYLVERYNHVNFTRVDSERMTRSVKPVWTALGLGSSAAHTVELLGETISFNALPGVGEELRGVLKQPGDSAGIFAGEILTDARFTKTAMLAALEKHRPLVHIASHFAFAAGDESRSFLLLGDGSAMTLAEMRKQPNLFEGVELLTLSACNTAAQQTGNGREVDAFSELAQRLGAGAVMATLWSVADNSTPALMREFYELKLNKHLTKAEALRQSQLALLNGATEAKPLATRSDSSPVEIVIVEKPEEKTRKTETALRSKIIYLNRQSAPPFVKDKTKPFAHPFYWSPFIMFGNWR